MAINEEIQAVLSNPETSYWLKSSLENALHRDCVDAANDAELLHDLLTRRCDEALNADSAFPQLELTIIQSANTRFEAVFSYFEKIKDGTADLHDQGLFNAEYGALSALLDLGLLSNSGMSLAGRSILRKLEEASSAAYREFSGTAQLTFERIDS
ncbi:hypothetical protein HBO38_34330 [Pseudomonas veronii]|uniref:Uncharacterized protein n=1 Tax=Pseudomonas veronii TaxID=76761 RepID=A0A7Y1FCZ5_PSEVE|nr:hypothetical protein [Pseudomonas veronii]NMY13414.1 hypothetical protein [Pseudomonas veronii]